MGPLVVVAGCFAFYLGILCWAQPESKIVKYLVFDRYPPSEQADPISNFFGLTREQAGPANLFVWRIVGVLIGGVFAIIGLWTTISQIHCGLQLPAVSSVVGPLSWRDPSWVFVFFAGVIGVINGYRMRPILRELYILCTIGIGIAGSEAAAFHTGVQGSRWFALGIASLALSGFVWFLNGKCTRRVDSVAGAERQP